MFRTSLQNLFFITSSIVFDRPKIVFLCWIQQVAAIFKIGNSKDMPDIPDYLSNDAKKFVRLCLQRNPSDRPTASQLLDHPFIREQTTTRSSNIKLTKDAFPYAFDGSRTPVKPFRYCLLNV